MVTSSAVVGSSAISTSGSLAIAIAIIARWRMPPENSCGYWSTGCSGFGMPTRSSSSIARARALPCRSTFWCACDRLGDLVPDVQHRVERGQRVLEDHRDLAAAELRAAPSCCIFSRSRAARALPRPGRSGPAAAGAARGSRAWLTLLPEPDSPTIPSVSPAWTSKLSRRRRGPRRRRSRTRRRGRGSTGRGSGTALRCVGSSASRRPSPTKLMQSTISRSSGRGR